MEKSSLFNRKAGQVIGFMTVYKYLKIRDIKVKEQV